MRYTINKNLRDHIGDFKGRQLPFIHVTNEEGKLVFKFPVQGELVFATTSLSRLWVLEHTPVGDFSTEVDLETGKACSRKMKGNKWGEESYWMYLNEDGEDKWLRKMV